MTDQVYLRASGVQLQLRIGLFWLLSSYTFMIRSGAGRIFARRPEALSMSRLRKQKARSFLPRAGVKTALIARFPNIHSIILCMHGCWLTKNNRISAAVPLPHSARTLKL